MSLLSRHILRTLAAPFGWGVVALTGMLLLNSLASLIDRLGGKGLPPSIMVEAIALALPALMVLTLPMAVLTATLYAYGQLAADMELVAMYANGVSVWRMARPALIGAFGVAVVNFILFDQFVPRSNARYKALLGDVAQKYPTLALQPRQLNLVHQSKPYVLLAEEIDSTGALKKVTIYDLGGGASQKVIHADSGRMKQDPNGTDLLLTLHVGEILEFSALPQIRMQRTTFNSDQFRLRNVTNQLSQTDEAQRQRGDREMSGCELLDGAVDQAWYIADGAAQREILARRDLRRLVGLPATPPPATQLRPKTVKHCGVYRRGEEWLERKLLSPSALAAKIADSIAEATQDRIREQMKADAAARARNPMPSTDQAQQVPLQPGDSVAKAAAMIAAAAQPQIPPGDSAARAVALISAGAQPPTDPTVRGLPAIHDSVPTNFLPATPQAATELVTSWSEITGARQEERGARLRVAAYQVEYHKKWAIPLSSFCFVLLGLALALRNPRGGIGLVIGGSLVIFMVFYILIIGGENLAKKLYVDPAAAMQGPLIAFTLLGLLSVFSANREMGSARGGSIFDRVMDFFRRHLRKSA